MVTRRIATAAVLFALVGAACASRDGTNVAAGPAAAAVTPAAPVVESTTTTSTTVPQDTTPEPVAATPVVNPAPKPAPATIEVDYQPQNGSTARATITGPNGSHSKSLDSGAALFGGLPAGTYSVTITVDTPSDDPTIGDARQIINGNSVHVEAGEHAVLTCDDTGCTGTL
jgi:hypothetical protein